jgi:hypothetical protein
MTVACKADGGGTSTMIFVVDERMSSATTELVN